MTEVKERARGLAVAFAVFSAQKAVFLLLLVVVVAHGHTCCASPSLVQDLTRWDGGWYLGVLRHGYSFPHTGLSNLAFFPLLPLAGRAVAATGIDPRTALLLVGLLGTALAVWGVHAVGKEVAGPRVAFFLVTLWAVAPRSLVEVMGYTEGAYTAAVAGALVLALRGRWVAAGALAAVAALLRPSVIVLLATFGLVLLASMWAHVRRRPTRADWLPSPRAGLIGLALPVAALGLVLVHVAVRTGDPLGYLRVQERWGASGGGLVGTWDRLSGLSAATADAYGVRYTLLISLSLLLYAGLLAWMLWRREHPLLVLYVGLMLLLVLVNGPFHSKARWLVPAFPAFLPAARLLARVPTPVAAGVLVVLTGLSAWWNLDVLVNAYSP